MFRQDTYSTTLNRKTLLFSWNSRIYLDYHVNENGKHKWYLLPNFRITLSPPSIHLKLDENVRKIIGVFFPFSRFWFLKWDILRELLDVARGSIPNSVLNVSGPLLKKIWKIYCHMAHRLGWCFWHNWNTYFCENRLRSGRSTIDLYEHFFALRIKTKGRKKK